MAKKTFILLSCLAFMVTLVFISGCGDKYYIDQKTGMTVRELGSDLDNRWALKGVIVESIKPNSPADGLISAGELISYVVDERKVENRKDFRDDLSDALEEDETAMLRISKVVSATDLSDLGVQTRIDPEGRGVIVDQIKPESKARQSGIKLETVIYEVDGENITNVDEFNQKVSASLQSSGKVTLNIGRTIIASSLRKVGFDELEDAPGGGVIVKKLEVLKLEGSPASMEGITVDDIITHVIDEIKIEDIESYKKAIDKAVNADRVILKRGELGGIKLVVIDALGEIGDTRAVEPLLQALESKDRWIRRSASNALKKLDDERVIQPLTWHLLEENEPDLEVRRNAAEALAKFRPLESMDALAKALRDSSLGVRLLAGNALGRIGEPAIDLLIEARHSSDSKIRDIAVAALGRAGGRRVKNELISVLRDENEESTVKLTAIQALSKIGDPESIAELRKIADSGDPGLSAFVKELLATRTGSASS